MALTAALLLAPPTVIVAQQGPAVQQESDSRWQPWLGCWRPNGTFAVAASDSATTPPVPSLVCVVPGTTPTSVQVVNFTNGRVVSRGIVDPTGVKRERTEDNCAGWETARWSSDSRRVMLQSEFTCANGVRRTETGVIAMTPAGDWLQIQNIDVNGNSAVYVGRLRQSGIAIEGIVDGALVEQPTLDESGQRISPVRVGCEGTESVTPSRDGQRVTVVSDYECAGLRRIANAVFERRADGQWVRVDRTPVPFTTVTARLGAGAAVGTDAVVEMVRHVDVATVEAWLTDRNQSFDLSGRQLVALASEGVPGRVIDVLVALDNPAVLTVRRSVEPTRGATEAERAMRGQLRMGGVLGGTYIDPWMNPWDPYGFNYRYGYGYGFGIGGAYGYDRFANNGFWGMGYPYQNRPIVVIPRGIVDQRARAVFGSGYTRDGSTPVGVSPSVGSSRPAPVTTGTAGSTGSGTSGSSGSSSGRTAKARGGN